MKTINYKRLLGKYAILVLLPVVSGLISCSENIDNSNLYTFTGETIEDYLTNRNDKCSSFNYILQRAGMDKILSGYGTYTCFAPTNEAVKVYIDSLYDDNTNKDFEHNGMTSRSLEGLSDSLCNDIALFHLVNSKVRAVDMSNGMTIGTMLGRDINTSIDPQTGSTLVNVYSRITSLDNDLENGVLHEIDNVLRRSNRLVSGEMGQHPEFRLFSQALALTGLADSLTAQQKNGLAAVNNNPEGNWVPEVCKEGYTLFAETDDVLKANGINDIQDLISYSNRVYAHCADAGTGWYDYFRNEGIIVSTGTDYSNPYNCLNIFLRYHILKLKVPYDKLVFDYNQVSKVSIYEYYETMLPYTLMKVIRVNGKRLINRWVTNNTLTDRLAEMGSTSIQVVKQEGLEIANTGYQALNGYIHPIGGMMVYDAHVPHGVLNERMRFDDTSLLWEMASNSIRGMTKAEILANAANVKDKNIPRVQFPSNYFNNLIVYNGENTRLRYLAKDEGAYSNYQGDEFLCIGAYDFAFRLPPVPDGTYELRMGYTANGNRGMVQFYIGKDSRQTSMRALDIPLDMRNVPVDNADGSPDANTGWCLYTKTSDMGVESDQNMHNLGWMRGPLYYTIGVGGATIARANAQDLRRIIVKQRFKQGEYWLRFKTVLPDNTGTQFHLDYIEFCPENVYNNKQYVEDMY